MREGQGEYEGEGEGREKGRGREEGGASKVRRRTGTGTGTDGGREQLEREQARRRAPGVSRRSRASRRAELAAAPGADCQRRASMNHRAAASSTCAQPCMHRSRSRTCGHVCKVCVHRGRRGAARTIARSSKQRTYTSSSAKVSTFCSCARQGGWCGYSRMHARARAHAWTDGRTIYAHTGTQETG